MPRAVGCKPCSCGLIDGRSRPVPGCRIAGSTNQCHWMPRTPRVRPDRLEARQWSARRTEGRSPQHGRVLSRGRPAARTNRPSAPRDDRAPIQHPRIARAPHGPTTPPASARRRTTPPLCKGRHHQSRRADVSVRLRVVQDARRTRGHRMLALPGRPRQSGHWGMSRATTRDWSGPTRRTRRHPRAQDRPRPRRRHGGSSLSQWRPGGLIHRLSSLGPTSNSQISGFAGNSTPDHRTTPPPGGLPRVLSCAGRARTRPLHTASWRWERHTLPGPCRASAVCV